ncbi:hypothetical protein CBL_00484 [Carabus blaptoides fortunei]
MRPEEVDSRLSRQAHIHTDRPNTRTQFIIVAAGRGRRSLTAQPQKNEEAARRQMRCCFVTKGRPGDAQTPHSYVPFVCSLTISRYKENNQPSILDNLKILLIYLQNHLLIIHDIGL